MSDPTCYINDYVCSYEHVKGDEIKEGDIRLVGGRYLWEGRVEILLSGEWGTISHDGASNTNAVIACRQRGYNSYGNTKLES